MQRNAPEPGLTDLQPDQCARQPIARAAAPGMAVVEHIIVAGFDPALRKTFGARFRDRDPPFQDRLGKFIEETGVLQCLKNKMGKIGLIIRQRRIGQNRFYDRCCTLSATDAAGDSHDIGM